MQHLAIRCPYQERASAIGDVVQVYSGAHGRTMIFTSTKQEANELTQNSVIKQETQVLHGDIAQKQVGLVGAGAGFRFGCKCAHILLFVGIPKFTLRVLYKNQRELTLENFRQGKFRCLVATDVAAR